MNMTDEIHNGICHTAVSSRFSSLLTAHCSLGTFYFFLPGHAKGLHPQSNP
jgi:hypothetical protein